MTTALACRSIENGIVHDFFDQATYDLLLRRAASILRCEPRGYFFEPSDLVHDAFLRIARSAATVRLQNAAHLLALATIVMRRIMIDNSRAPSTKVCTAPVPLDFQAPAVAPSTEILVIRDALASLAGYEERMLRIVEMRFYGGLGIQEIAVALDVSSRTVKRDWRAAREHLHALLSACPNLP